jgi:hypothetical protein
VAPVGARRLLRELDRRVLPPLARGLDGLAGGGVRARLFAVAALGSTAVVLVVAVWVAAREPVTTAEAGSVVTIGLVDGQTIPGYVESSRTELGRLLAQPPGGSAPADTYALVALKAYLAPDRLAPVLVGVSVAEVLARVPLAGQQTEIVHIAVSRGSADLATGMVQVAQDREARAARYQGLSAKLTGNGRQERRLRAMYDSWAQLALAEATAYRSHCSCLYAAVVRGAPTALEHVADRPEVRAVDPAPEVHRLDRAVFLPPLPEQADSGPPAVVVAPSPSPAGAATRPRRPHAPSDSPAVPSASPRSPTFLPESPESPESSWHSSPDALSPSASQAADQISASPTGPE